MEQLSPTTSPHALTALTDQTDQTGVEVPSSGRHLLDRPAAHPVGLRRGTAAGCGARRTERQ